MNPEQRRRCRRIREALHRQYTRLVGFSKDSDENMKELQRVAYTLRKRMSKVGKIYY